MSSYQTLDGTEQPEEANIYQHHDLQDIEITFRGRKIRVFDGDKLGAHLAKGRYYDIENLRLTKQYIGPDTIVIDIGANIGNHSLYYLIECGCKNVHAFEPVPETFALLLHNLKDFSNALSYNIGLSDEVRTYDHGGINPERVGSTVFAESDTGTVFQTLDEYELNAGFIKIDVEGFELNVLKGALETIHRCRPVIAVEVRETEAISAGMGQHLPETAVVVKEFLLSEGYKIRTTRTGATQFICIPTSPS